MTRHLLIDADIVAYQCCGANEVEEVDKDGYHYWYADPEKVKEAFLDHLDYLMDSLWADDYTLCVSDSPHNFRHDILPSYKGNRTGKKKPLVLKEVRRWIVKDLGGILRPGLEGDDCLGILATKRYTKLLELIVVSQDKDLQTIPCLLSRDNESIVEISKEYADYYHMLQTLSGDQTDGYTGCPGIGDVTARKILGDYNTTQSSSRPKGLTPTSKIISRGPRKGTEVIEYQEYDAESMWEAVVSRFKASGLTEEDALVQARVARILRAEDYDFKQKKVIPWLPYQTSYRSIK